MKRILLGLLPLIVVSCAHHSPIYWGWGEWAAPETKSIQEALVARLDWSTLPGVITSIDGNKVGKGFKKARMMPGKHRIEYAYYPAEFGAHPTGSFELELKAGHVYDFRIKLCFSCMPRKSSVWVEDKTSGELAWGQHSN
jgi:hypothetical protein